MTDIGLRLKYARAAARLSELVATYGLRDRRVREQNRTVDRLAVAMQRRGIVVE